MIADEVVRAAGEVGELRGGDVDPQPLIERGEDVAEVDRPGARLIPSPACDGGPGMVNIVNTSAGEG